MNTLSIEIKSLLAQLEVDIKDGSSALVQYAAERRQHIAEAIAANSPDLGDIVKAELLNIQTFAATEAVKRADKIDAAILKSILMVFSAFDTMLLASLS